MLRTERTIRHFAALSTVLMATAEALAQEGRVRQSRRVLVSIPDRKLAVIEDGRVVRVYRTAVGRPSSPSPTGCYTIVQRLVDPTWYYKGKVVPPGKSNPLGTRWLGLSAKGYGIHGTNAPGSIGRNASHGCIRMRNADVEQLYALVEVGDEVELRGERDAETERIFGNPEKARPVLLASAAGASREAAGATSGDGQ